MGFGSTFGDIGASFGAIQGWQDTAAERDAIEQALGRNMDFAGQLDPDSIKDAGESEFKGMSTDPRVRAYQTQALGQLAGIANSNGLDPQALAMQHEATATSNANEQAQRQAILQSMQARGMGGSGAEIAGLLSNQQGGANRSAEAGIQSAAQSRMRAMQALGQMGQQAGQLRDQDWSQAAQRAGAMDAMGRFNAGQSQARFNASLGKQAASQSAIQLFNQGKREKAAGTIGEDAANARAVGGSIGSIADMGTSGMGGGGMMGGGGAQMGALGQMSSQPYGGGNGIGQGQGGWDTSRYSF